MSVTENLVKTSPGNLILKLFRMNELSIIEEVVLEQGTKGLNETTDKSGDSGVVSADNSSIQSGKKDTEIDRGLIIQFQALNAKSNNVRESTFVHHDTQHHGNCNISRIENEVGAQTVNSDDGKRDY